MTTRLSTRQHPSHCKETASTFVKKTVVANNCLIYNFSILKTARPVLALATHQRWTVSFIIGIHMKLNFFEHCATAAFQKQGPEVNTAVWARVQFGWICCAHTIQPKYLCKTQKVIIYICTWKPATLLWYHGNNADCVCEVRLCDNLTAGTVNSKKARKPQQDTERGPWAHLLPFAAAQCSSHSNLRGRKLSQRPFVHFRWASLHAFGFLNRTKWLSANKCALAQLLQNTFASREKPH